MRDLLLELGTEEIPARVVTSGMNQLLDLAANLLDSKQIKYQRLEAFGTPRRLVLLGHGVEEFQGNLVKRIRGPAANVAFDESGRPTQAAIGFAKSKGVSVDDLEVREDYVYVNQVEAGKPSIEVLPEVLSQIITSLEFPRLMRWGTGEDRFVRPVRWIVALFGGEVIPFSVFGLKSDRFTYGHRFLSSGPIELRAPEDYIRALRDNWVIVDPEERKQLILSQARSMASSVGGAILADGQLVEEVNFLLEYPTAFLGSFNKDYLSLPKEVLITTMQHHQRYFPVINPEDNELLPYFVGVRNGDDTGLDLVRAGNEKVLNARLADARFFYEEDLKRPLSDRFDDLEGVLFQERLGTLKEKVRRLETIAQELATTIDLEAHEKRKLSRAVMLCKTDLVTQMVREFPELQGTMGRIYAAINGEEPEVAEAVYEHYLPRHVGDLLPKTKIGAILSISDKLDTLASSFAIGLQPTGSQDPYGLRRLAWGVMAIVYFKEIQVPISKLISVALDTLDLERQDGNGVWDKNKVKSFLLDFLAARLESLLLDDKFDNREVEAVLALGADKAGDARRRASALAALRGSKELEDAAVAFRRAYNLSKNVHLDGDVNAGLFEEAAESDLFNVYQAVRVEASGWLQRQNFKEYVRSIAKLKPAIDAFFDKVLVMTDNEEIRANRLKLLSRVAGLGLQVGDLSKLLL